MTVTVSNGLDAAIDAAAERADPRYAFLGRSWFAAAGGRDMTTLVMRGPGGDIRIALPVAGEHPMLHAVPGSYWPFRSFPVAMDANPDDMIQLLSDPAARDALGPVWRVGPVYGDDPALALLRAAARDAGWCLAERHIATSFVLPLADLAANGDWPRNSSLRKNRFHEKHLAAHGVLDWEFHQGPDWGDALFDDLATIEARSWHARSSDPKFLPGPHRRFWERLVRDPAQAARMNVAMLRIGGQPVAFSFDLDSGATRYAIANSYDPAFAKHSPGKCLQYRNLAQALEQGIMQVDWGAGDAGYKQTLGAEAGEPIVDCLMLRTGWRTPFAHLAARMWKRSGRR